MIKNLIADGEGTGRIAAVTPQNALKVLTLPGTSRGFTERELAGLRIYREFLSNTAGSTEMAVDGSVTNVEFRIVAASTQTKWIKQLRFTLEDANMELTTADFRRFGAATGANTPLTNGIQIEAVQGGILTNIAAEPITVLGDFLNYADAYLNFANAISASEDFVLFDFDFMTPIVLVPGSNDYIAVRIRDNLTAVNTFRCLGRGIAEIL